MPWRRWVGLGALVVGELAALMLRFDTDSLRRAGEPWWADELWRWKFVLPPLALAIATAALVVGGERLRADVRRAAGAVGASPPTWPFLAAHLVGFALFVRLTAAILEGGFAASHARWAWIAAWFATAAATLACWALCALPRRSLVVLARGSGTVLVTGTVVGAAAWAAGQATETWWDPLRASTIGVVGALVRVLAPDAVVDAPRLVVGTERFSVRILTECSGYEGIGLIWVFLGAYLWFFRATLRFPRALLVLPIGTAVVWTANALRVTALIAIGTWISPAIALGGFHTYGGALLFSAVALALVYGVRRSRFFTVPDVATAPSDDATTAYLLPFLAILATAMATGALSTGSFDAGYPLRVVVAGAILWRFRGAYAELRPTWSWAALAYGAAAFALWLALAPARAPADVPLGAALRALPAWLAAAWLAARVGGAVVTVPLTEELAFRGYVARRLVDADFRRVPLRRISLAAVVGSSTAFGVLHGRIVAATLAGALYALAARRRGELADAVIAHAVTNAAIAAYVLATGNWALWD